MASFLYRSAIGLLGGVISGFVAFETVSILFFAIGLYSSALLRDGAVIGIVTGAIFGPIFALLHTPWRKALAWEGGALALLGFVVWMWFFSTGLVYSSSQDAFESLVVRLVYAALCGGLAGAATAWAVSQLDAYFRSHRLAGGEEHARSSSSGNRERRYRI